MPRVLFFLLCINFQYEGRNESNIRLIESSNINRKNCIRYFQIINNTEYAVGRQIAAAPSKDIETPIFEIINKSKNHICIQNIKNKKLS